MTLDTIEKSGLDAVRYDSNNKLSALHSGFESKLTPIGGQYYKLHNNIDNNIAQWLHLEPGSQIDIDVRGGMIDAVRDMYYGTEANGYRTLGLQEIHNWKRSGEYRDINTKQQAGFAAEVISTTKENLIAQNKGTGIITRRADDLPELYRKNDQYVDKVRFDPKGNVLETIQTKFVGNNGEECLSKLMTKKFDKYVFDGKVDKIEIPKDFYDEIRSNKLIETKRLDIEKQLSRVKELGKTDVVQNLEHKLDKLNKLDSMLEGSTVTMQEAIDGVVHPQRVTAKLFADEVKEAVKAGNETAIKSGLVSAGITLAVSTVDNVSSFIDGEITAEEMVVDIVTETAAAGAIEYGSEIISTAVSHAMSKSSSTLISKVAGTSLPAAMVSFAVESYDCVTAYAKGEIDGAELAYELGDNAASIAGAMKGSAIGATIGSVAGPVGSVAGALVGGVVGAAVASEIYATAVEIGAEGVELIAEKAETLAQNTVELFEEHLPDKLDVVKTAFSDFFNENNLPFSL